MPIILMCHLDDFVKAKSQKDAAKLFRNHAHFMIFPGDRVEVMECLPSRNLITHRLQTF